MNLKLKTLVAAVAMVAAGAAQAAILTDGINGGAGIGAGTGDAELLLSIYDANRNQSLVLDLNLTANQFRFNNAALINTFSVTDPLLQSFIAGSPNQSLMRWNIGGASNLASGPSGTFELGLLSTHGTAGSIIDPAELPGVGATIFVGMNQYEAYAIYNSDRFTATNPNSAISNALVDASGHMAGLWGPSIGGALTYINEQTGFADTQLMSFMYADPTNLVEGTTFATVFANGAWKVDPTLGKVSYVATVPVPAAVWLFASGLLGLVGISRRRKQV